MIEVWGRRSSINVQKVLLALEECGQPFERHAVGGQFGGTDDKAFQKMNPNALVPVMKDGTITLFESNAIMRYLARKYGKDTIRPRGQKAWALADQWTDWTATTLTPQMFTVLVKQVRCAPEDADPAAVKVAAKNLEGLFKIANRAIGRKPWMTGRHFNYADIAMGAFYWRYKKFDIKHAKTPNLDRWMDQLTERPAFQKWGMVEVGNNMEEWAANEKKYG
ncbi:MAG: glutathione S-transferase family protein [Anderseniella sp.]|nr:glutathione S-transferase family protein [Anderseniella sp.]